MRSIGITIFSSLIFAYTLYAGLFSANNVLLVTFVEDRSLRVGNRIEPGRIDTIDFWRGLILLIIFVNHVPGNIFETITPRNFGFSDSAEAFVFISGLSVAVAWGKSIAQRDLRGVIKKAWKRSFLLYAIHLLLSFTAIALFASAYAFTGKDIFLLGHGRDVVFETPVAAILGIISGGHQLGYYNILPLYVLLVFAAPFMLLAAWHRPLITLAASSVLYGIAQVPAVNLPNWPTAGGWFLNPLAWQFVFVIGMVIGVSIRRFNVKISSSRLVAFFAAVFLIIATILTTNAFGFKPGLFDSIRLLGGFEKTDTGIMRLVHFLSLAFLVVHSRIAERAMHGRIGQAISLMGRHGLGIFALGSVLSSIGQIIAAIIDDVSLTGTMLTGIIVVPAGIMCLYWFARYMENVDKSDASLLKHKAA